MLPKFESKGLRDSICIAGGDGCSVRIAAVEQELDLSDSAAGELPGIVGRDHDAQHDLAAQNQSLDFLDMFGKIDQLEIA